MFSKLQSSLEMNKNDVLEAANPIQPEFGKRASPQCAERIQVQVARVTLPKSQTYVKIMSDSFVRARIHNHGCKPLSFLLQGMPAYDRAILQK